MKSFTQIFAKYPVILPVIHVESLDQALRNATIAQEQQCDGIFLINHGLSYPDLLAIHHKVITEFPDWWIGVNCLDLQPWDVFDKLSEEVAGLWVDNAHIDERVEAQSDAEKIDAARKRSGWSGLYFGGVAFKYQRHVDHLERAATLARQYVDVVTTSGPGTARAADVSKIQALKQALGPIPLAIASGITPANVHQYLDIADCFLVASGISQSWTELDPQLVGKLVARVQAARRDKLSS
jgi:hypothetical protein